jgi:predicted HicB family RNase H-like nuclease
MKREKSATIQLKMRMKEPLRARLEESARDRGVSLNAEGVSRLERSFQDRDSLGLRVTAQTKRNLQKAAAASGRSQSQEAEFRLERSFDDDRFAALMGEAAKMWGDHDRQLSWVARNRKALCFLSRT